MGFAKPMQNIQDWITQQWVITTGKKIDPTAYSWIIGPFGENNVSGNKFITELAAKEKLTIIQSDRNTGLLPSINKLKLSENELAKLSQQIIDFYEKTSNYDFEFTVKWNSMFKVFGILISSLFSSRLGQLNLPTNNSIAFQKLRSEIITLVESESNETKYTCWLRYIQSSDQPIYSGIYGVSTLPSGKRCIKAIFPLPNGNATVLMTPRVSNNGELILESSGNRFGEAGLYFLLKDAKGKYWTKYIKSFHDCLHVKAVNNILLAEQVLTLWGKEVLRFNYKIQLNKLKEN
ncbi:hypothetical protein GCM10027036_20870 [Flavihumibacter cheonanensis]